MKYCCDCGAATTRQWVQFDARYRCVCTSCGATHYENPRVIVCCVVSWKDEILFCRRSQDPARGQWTVPSGYLECGETLQEGAARETLEETGVRVDPLKLELYSVMNLTEINQIVISFRTAFSKKPVVTAGEECLDAAFMSEREIPFIQMAWASGIENSAYRFFEELRTGRYAIQLLTVGPGTARYSRIREYQLMSEPPVKSLVD
jgi:ADP-ribose pyrophosphatase YjhB (NUDIX family)